MSGGSPKPSALVWTLAGQELTNYEDLGLHTIQVEVTRNWNGKILKCHVTQKDDFVSAIDLGTIEGLLNQDFSLFRSIHPLCNQALLIKETHFLL